MVASWPNPYSYLCDSIEVVCPRELECEDGEYFVLSKGVELVDEENSSKGEDGENVSSDIVQLRRRTSALYTS